MSEADSPRPALRLVTDSTPALERERERRLHEAMSRHPAGRRLAPAILPVFRKVTP